MQVQNFKFVAKIVWEANRRQTSCCHRVNIQVRKCKFVMNAALSHCHVIIKIIMNTQNVKMLKEISLKHLIIMWLISVISKDSNSSNNDKHIMLHNDLDVLFLLSSLQMAVDARRWHLVINCWICFTLARVIKC